MRERVMNVAWYRFASTFSRRWSAYLSIVLLVGLIGGVGLGSIAMARRTQSSFSTFLASTHPSDMSLSGVFAPNLTKDLERLPGVVRVESYDTSLNAFPLNSRGGAVIPPGYASGDVSPIGSIDGEYFDQDRVAVTAGRLADPARADEFDATAQAEKLLGWHVGEVLPIGFFSSGSATSPGFGTGKVKPLFHLNMKLVGTMVLNNEVVLDAVDRYPTYLLFTPAATRPFLSGMFYGTYALKLKDGAAGVSAVERDIVEAIPPGTTYLFHVTSIVQGQVDRTVKPEAIALGVFGSIATLAALLIALQIISRQLRVRDDEYQVLRALGSSRALIVADGLLGITIAVLAGAVLAVGIAIGLSPLAPIGPVRDVYPTGGIAFDGTVLGFGFLALLVGIGGGALVLALGSSPNRLQTSAASRTTRPSVFARLAANSGAPVSAVTGIRFALESGRGRTAVPVRSALLGTVLAVAVVVATLTFGSGLNTLVSHPALYGWDWSYAVTSDYVVPPQVVSLLRRDPDVAASSDVSFANAQINGQTVPILLVDNHARVVPPMLSGHPVETDHEIVLGAATLAQLHVRVGEYVRASYGTPKDYPVYVPPTRMLVVGTATLPAVGAAQALHTSMGIGAEIPVGIEPPAFVKFLTSPDPTLNGPGMVFVRFKPGVDPTKALAGLQRIAAAGDRAFAAVPNNGGGNASVSVLPVQYPAEIENYRSIGSTPVLLAAGLAIGTVVALGLTLTASVRRRRRDLALLKSIGFTQRQLISSVAWQSSVAVFIGILVGTPLGILLGRRLWILFAHEISAVPEPTVPTLVIVGVGIAALVLANVIAAIPGRYAARTPTALILRAE